MIILNNILTLSNTFESQEYKYFSKISWFFQSEIPILWFKEIKGIDFAYQYHPYSLFKKEGLCVQFASANKNVWLI